MARPRKFKTLLEKINDPALKALWQLRAVGRITNNPHNKEVRAMIVERVNQIRAKRKNL